MAHEYETGVLMRGLKAWHSLGNVVQVGDPAERNAMLALQKGGMDWTVSMQPVWMFNPLWEANNALPKGIKLPGVRAIMRDSDCKILGNAGDVPRGEAQARSGYQIFQNSDMANWFQPVLDVGEAKIEAAASLFGGQRVYMLARLGHNGDSEASVVEGDRVVNHWLVANDFSGKHSLRVARCRTRVVCANTLAAAYGEGTYVKIRHSSAMKATMADLQAMMRKENEAFTKDVDLFRTLAKKSITRKSLRDYVQSIFPESFKEKKETKVERETRERAERMKVYDAHKVQGKSLVDDLLGASEAPRHDLAAKIAEATSDILERVEILVETGRGTDVPGVRGTMWGAYNAISEYLQYEYGRGAVGATDKRMDAMVFGQPATWNALALQKALDFGKVGG